ncbi:MAG: hypothetical protein AAFX02_06660, partial [Pseudomonadota bacterium]
QISAVTSLIVNSSGNALPAATIIGAAGRLPPTEVAVSADETPVNLQNAADDATNIFDPENDGLDFFESLEGMLVTVDNPTVVAATNGFGEVVVV